MTQGNSVVALGHSIDLITVYTYIRHTNSASLMDLIAADDLSEDGKVYLIVRSLFIRLYPTSTSALLSLGA